MNEKDKAIELYEKYLEFSCCVSEKKLAVKSALVFVDGVLDIIQDKKYSMHLKVNNFFQYAKNVQYWQVVKDELKKMLFNLESTSNAY
jgi:predicted oxidoreductase